MSKPADNSWKRKFARDTHRARLPWIKAKMFIGSSGGVTERNMAIDVSEEIARKGQELREMTRDLDLLKVDVKLMRQSSTGNERGGEATGLHISPHQWLESDTWCRAETPPGARVPSPRPC
jgi:hypothetical protein